MAKKKPDPFEGARQTCAGGACWIRVGMSTCGIAAGADEVFAALVEEAEKRKIPVSIRRCGCSGRCYAEPLVEVKTAGLPAVTYGKVDRETAVRILDEHVAAGKILNDHVYDVKAKG